jgi:hypothetical protein
MSGLIPGAIIGMAWAATAFFSTMRDKAIAVFEKHVFLYWIILAVVLLVLFGLVPRLQVKEQVSLYAFPLMAIMLYFSLITNYPLWKQRPRD